MPGIESKHKDKTYQHAAMFLFPREKSKHFQIDY